MNCIDEYVKGKCFGCGAESVGKYHGNCQPCYLECCKGGTAPVMVWTENGMIYIEKDMTHELL